MEEKNEEKEFKEQLEGIPKNKEFPLVKIEKVCIPHPYCITPKHLKYNKGMCLNIEEAEERSRLLNPNDSRKWAVCDICRIRERRGLQDKILSYKEHETQKTLFVEVEDNSREGLTKNKKIFKYLRRIKQICEKLGIQGFAFPQKKVV